MKLDLLGTQRLAPHERFAAEKRFHTYLGLCLLVLAGWLFVPGSAHAAVDFNMPILNDFFCGFINFSKTTLAAVVAVGVLIITMIGMMVGNGKIWGTLMVVCIGLAFIAKAPSIVASAVGATGVSCLV